MHTLSIVLLFVTLGLTGWFIWSFVKAYTKAPGSFWQRTLAAGRESATIVWAKLVVIGSGVVLVIDRLSDLAGDPSWLQQFQQYATPQMFGYAMIAVMLVNIWARLRTLGK